MDGLLDALFQPERMIENYQNLRNRGECVQEMPQQPFVLTSGVAIIADIQDLASPGGRL